MKKNSIIISLILSIILIISGITYYLITHSENTSEKFSQEELKKLAENNFRKIKYYDGIYNQNEIISENISDLDKLNIILKYHILENKLYCDEKSENCSITYKEIKNYLKGFFNQLSDIDYSLLDNKLIAHSYLVEANKNEEKYYWYITAGGYYNSTTKTIDEVFYDNNQLVFTVAISCFYNNFDSSITGEETYNLYTGKCDSPKESEKLLHENIAYEEIEKYQTIYLEQLPKYQLTFQKHEKLDEYYFVSAKKVS